MHKGYISFFIYMFHLQSHTSHKCWPILQKDHVRASGASVLYVNATTWNIVFQQSWSSEQVVVFESTAVLLSKLTVERSPIIL